MKNRVQFVFLVSLLLLLPLGLSGCTSESSSTGMTMRTTQFSDAEGECSNGGVKIEVLVDGSVDDTQTQYICNGEPGQDGPHTTIQTTAFDDEQGGCINGGVKIEVLVDGAVDDTKTQYICNGAQGGQGGTNNIRMTTEDPGEHCTNGGLKIEVLVDGSVDDTKTQYICNGAQGSQGGTNSIRTTTEDPGEHCANGGVKIEVLVDGSVDDTQTKYICNGANGQNGTNDSTPEDTLEACMDGVDNDGDGQTDCLDSECTSFCQKCGTNQTYIAKYDLCAHNIHNRNDFLALRDTWNASGSRSYIIEDGKPAAFVLINDIALNAQSNWVGIGTSDKPFNGMLIGNGKTISGNLTSTTGLFGTVQNATVEGLNLNITASGTSVAVLASSATGMTINDVNLTGNVTASSADSNITASAGGLLNTCTNCTLTNVTVNSNVTASNSKNATKAEAGGVIKECNDCSLNHVSYSGSVSAPYAGGIMSRGYGSLKHITADVSTSVSVICGYWAGLVRLVSDGNLTVQDADVIFTLRNNYTAASSSTTGIFAGGMFSSISPNYTAAVNHSKVNFITDFTCQRTSSSSQMYAYFGGIAGSNSGVLDANDVDVTIGALVNIYYSSSSLNIKTYLGGIVGYTKNGILNNIRVTVNKLESPTAQSYLVYNKGLLAAYAKDTEMQNISVHNNATSFAGTIPYVNYEAINLRVSNLNLISKYSGISFANIMNSSTLTTSYIDKLAAVSGSDSIFDSVVYRSMSSSANYTVSNSDKYSSAHKTVEILNKSLADKNPYLFKGNYFPWFVDENSNPDLNFDTAPDEMYSIP